MTGFTVAITDAGWAELTSALSRAEESAAVLGSRMVDGPWGTTLLVRSIAWAPEGAYERRASDELVLSSEGWVPALGAVERDGSVAIFVHTHPGGAASFSSKDRTVAADLAAPVRSRTRQVRFAHLVIGGTLQDPDVCGELLADDDRAVPLRGVRIAGPRLGFVTPKESGAAVPSVFDRHVRAFGVDGQSLLRALRIGIVGCGGTGSAAAEQLARLGIGHLSLIDLKTLTDGNVTRVHESHLADVGRPKVDVLAGHVRRIGLGTEVEPIKGSVVTEKVARALSGCDAVFGCTDDNTGRSVLSRLAYFLLTPLIDIGVVVRAPAQQVAGVYGRVTMCGPGAACLVCRNRIDWRLADAEVLDPQERKRLAVEGYVAGLNDPDPSVVVFTTFVASLGVSELLAGLFGYGPEPAPSEVLALIDRRRLYTNTVAPRDGCYCTDPEFVGAGEGAPFLDRVWI